MPGALLLYFDDRRRAIGEIAAENHKAFAERAGLTFVLHRSAHFAEPYLIKLDLLRIALDQFDFVLYADADVLFMPDAGLPWPKAASAPLCLSQDSNGVCAGVLSVTKSDSVRRLLEAWRLLGEMDACGHERDQATLKLLIANFTWVRLMTTLIPTSLVSNEECAKPGRIAHHFWCNARGDEAVAAKMREFFLA